MPLLQAMIADTDLDRLERYRHSLPYPTTRTAIVQTALRDWLTAREQELGDLAPHYTTPGGHHECAQRD